MEDEPTPPSTETLTLVENDSTDRDNLVEDSYSEGDDGGEIMVEIVGSDVFVDGLSRTVEEADLGAAQLSEAMDVSSEGGESKLESLEAKDEKTHLVTCEMKIADSDLGFPELEEGTNNVVTVENKMGEKDPVFTEPVDVVCEVVENKIGESESGLPELKDGKDYVVSEAMDVCNEGVENETGKIELGFSGASDVSGEVGENKVEISELGLANLKEEQENHVTVTEVVDGNVEVGMSPVHTEEAIVTTPMENSEDKTVKDEVAKDPLESQIVSSVVSLGPDSEAPAPPNVEVDGVDSAIVTARVVNPEDKIIIDEAVDDKTTTNLDHLGSDSLDGQIAPSEASLNPNGKLLQLEITQVDGIDSAMVMSQSVIIVGSTFQEEAVDKKTCKDPKQDSCDGEVPENVQVDGFDNFVAEEVEKFGEKGLVESDALDSDDFHGTKIESSHERGAVEEVDALLDVVDGGSNVNPPELSCVGVGNDETLKSGEDMEMDMVHQNHFESNDKEPSQPDDGFHADAVNKDEIKEVLDDGGLSENVEENVSEESKQSLDCQENDIIPNDLEHCCLPESKEPEKAYMIITEAIDHVMDERDSIPSEAVSVEAVSNTTQGNILSETGEKSELPFSSNTVSLGEIVDTVESKAMEVDFEIGNEETKSGDEIITDSHKRKHVPEDSPKSNEERSLMELTGPSDEFSLDTEEDESFAKKQKALDHTSTTDGYDKMVTTYAAKVTTLTGQNTSNNKPSFKIGECIRRVASQLTGSTGKDESVIDGSLKNTERRTMILSIESFSVNEMLSQLERVSQAPMRRHNFLNVIHTFFIGFRSSIALNRRGRKRRPEQTASGGPAEGFEFDDVSDSYWTDRIVQNYSELNGSMENLHAIPIVSEKPVKPSRRPNSRKRFSHPTVENELDERVKRRKQESSPAELILYFAERNRIPTEINLNKMFRRFGSLMESETEVDLESGCAKVIFKRGSDAEIARNSSEAFNIFAPVLVNYHIGYDPVVSVRVLPMAIPQPQEDTILMQ